MSWKHLGFKKVNHKSEHILVFIVFLLLKREGDVVLGDVQPDLHVQAAPFPGLDQDEPGR